MTAFPEARPDRGARLWGWAWRRLRVGWLSLLLLGGVYLVSAGSIEKAGWVPNSGAILAALALGMALGAALAAARWSGRAALAYTLLLAPPLACQAVGQVAPPLGTVFSLPFWGLVDLMNVRLFTLLARLGGWWALYQGGQTIQDTGLFVLLACLLVWLAGAWLTWSILRRQAVFSGLLPLGAALAVNVNLAGQDVTFLVIYLALGLLLLAYGSHRRQHQDWEARGLDYPEDLGLDWAAAATTLVLVIALGARLAPVFGTPEGWKAIADLFKPMQQQVEDTAQRIFGQVSPPRVSPEPQTLVETPQLGVVGAPPAQGTDLIFWVSTSDPPPPPPEAGLPPSSGPQHYWRSQVYATYTGRGWQEAPLASGTGAAPTIAAGAPPGRYLLQQTFTIEARHGVELFSAAEPVQVQAGAGPDQDDAPLALRATLPDGSTLVQVSPAAAGSTAVGSYRVSSYATRVTAGELAAAGTDYPPEIRSAYLQLPPGVPQRVHDLAARLAAGATNPYDIAIRIQNDLRLTYPYSLTVPPPPAGRDVTDYFLFEAPGGFCSYFATAMAVLLRSQGIPARVASGYASGSYDSARQAYAVTSGQAHAWVEVYFPGFDWVEFEPTPSQAPLAYGGPSPAGPEAVPTSQPASLPPALAALLLALGIGGGVAFLALLLRFLGSDGLLLPGRTIPDPRRQAQAHYFRVRRALGQAGLPAASSATPSEFLAQAGPRLAGRQGLAGALQQATRVYEQAAFSPRPPEAGRVEAAQQAWGRSFWEWIRMAAALWFN